MRAILIDDEYYALCGLKMELEEVGGIEIVGMYEEGRSALQEIKITKPDVVFLHIDMPNISGLELFEKFIEEDEDLKIVFTTAYDHYAVKAFELNALDYLIKPVQKQRLIKTVERLKKNVQIKKKNIYIECFRNFSILIDKIEINKGWRTKKAEELLAYLICEKGRFVSKEKIAGALWPNLDGDKSIANLYLAYHYLKKQEKKLGISFYIESERGKMRLKLDEIDCDIVSFDKCAEKCNSIDVGNIEIAERLIYMYKGMVFEDSYYTWAVEIQQYYENKYLGILKKTVNYYKKQGDDEKVIIFKKI